QGAPAAPPRPPQAGGQQPGAQQPGGQQIQPLNGEPPLTLYRDRRVIMLQPGTEVDRFGEPNGNVVYAMRTPYTHRSLPPQWANRSYFAYRVQRPVQALRGTAVPWFEQPGGGTAFVLPGSINDLLADGTLAEMPATERPPME
ncbi:TNT domain-containing protein, partial [Saccharopolyspora hordei]|uniref:TNT domain-containing protein n=1 Tax=Saccharopolyspora hordei TaxID=1838 RepID=UPI0035E7CBC8